MGKMLAASLALALTTFAPLTRAQDIPYPDQPFSTDQLDNLTAPIALYPDPLLAQVLVAATFPDQIDEAARFVRNDPNTYDVDNQPWDVSVRAVAHYPTVLQMMADQLDWTASLGQAYASQSTEVMESVQRLRAQAQSMGNLVNTPEMEVVDSFGAIELWPAQPQYIYVPVYNPALVFFHRAPLFFRPRFLIGAWLDYDFDWRQHHVIYHGWEAGRGGWIDRSRSHVRLTPVYVNPRYQNVVIGRTVIDRQVNYGALNGYNDIHRGATFDNLRPRGGVARNVPIPVTRPPITTNKVINRNINTGDPRIGQYRGYSPGPSPQVPAPVTPAVTPGRGGYSPGSSPQVRAPATPAVTPGRGGYSPGSTPQVRAPATPAVTPGRGGYSPGSTPQTRAPVTPVRAPGTPAFTPDSGGFDPRQASQRGAVSRARAVVSQPSPTPARAQQKKP
jgi:Protein of unknown function (DUF3300)